MDVDQLLSNLRNGDSGKAFDAGKALLRMSPMPIEEVIEILREAEGVHNRVAAAYAVSWMCGKYPKSHSTLAAAALLEAFNNPTEDVAVKAQALEGFASQTPRRGTKLWREVEAAILSALSEESVEIRFWACYAAGSIKLRSALPKLKELSEQDTRVYRGWWRVSEEAEDAIEWVHGRKTEDRTPMPIEAVDSS
ncbi:MAG: hypothetical protein QOJ64_1068 [Acidobacteriota bacterium]|jgi:hypothetical protein|nr:hypothetical protein [Acidobacteriota bacterium]